jgi:hypothetical protein
LYLFNEKKEGVHLASATPPKQLKTCIISQINFEIEMRGIPERYKTEINKPFS